MGSESKYYLAGLDPTNEQMTASSIWLGSLESVISNIVSGCANFTL